MKTNIVKDNINYTYKTLIKDIEFLKYEFREIESFKIGEIGKSTLKNRIPYIKIGEGEKTLFINASHHANEWITSLVCMLFFEKTLNLLRNKEKYKKYNLNELLKNTKIIIVPMVNPDGVDLVLKEKYIFEKKEYLELIFKNINKLKNWKANIRGVDLNLNYPAKWEKAKNIKKKIGIKGPNYRDYVGQNPLSEIETKNMVAFTNIHQFNMTISLHSQGEEIYYDDLKGVIKKSYEIGKKFESVSGYKLTKPEKDSSYAGYKDWYVDNFFKPGYTIEVGKGTSGEPLPIAQAKEILEKIEEIFLISLEECINI